ncbi:hypothetical protein [Azospirillum brasilense]|uniref:hypothetical protein n=1 Tax=Azospirillum brasilense TaxID=192 RepID=UPI0011C464CD|nr:hypothetical protein [Azospirillum brasilense]NUB26782.1 hypothetical protein [Azospirillum brasilense]
MGLYPQRRRRNVFADAKESCRHSERTAGAGAYSQRGHVMKNRRVRPLTEQQPLASWFSAWTAAFPFLGPFVEPAENGTAVKSTGAKPAGAKPVEETAAGKGADGWPMPTFPNPFNLPNPFQDAVDYGVDAMQRWVLFLESCGGAATSS